MVGAYKKNGYIVICDDRRDEIQKSFVSSSVMIQTKTNGSFFFAKVSRIGCSYRGRSSGTCFTVKVIDIAFLK